MLYAILQGKAGRTDQVIDANTSWRAAYKHNEDLLTSTVFERLAYLPPSLFLKIIGEAFKYDFSPWFDVDLVFQNFWPKLASIDETRSYVEPDIWIRFKDNHTKKLIDLIIEVKPTDGFGQNAQQWIGQVESYNKYFTTEDCDLEAADKMLYCALGGLRNLIAVKNKFLEHLENAPLNCSLGYCGWAKLLRIINEELDAETSRSYRNILFDIIEAIKLAGFNVFMPLVTLSDCNYPDIRSVHFDAFRGDDLDG